MKTFHRGTDVELDSIAYNTEELTPGDEKDVTGFTVSGRIGNKEKRITYLEVAGVVVDGSAGQVRVTLTDVQTNALAPAVYDYICEVIDAGSNKGIVTDEQFEILPSLATP